jgi:murein peptide amidase A
MLAKLGKNHGRYHGESIPIDAVQAEIHSAAVGHGWICDTLLENPGVVIRAYRRPFAGARHNIYVSTGIHGDEPSGPLAVLELLRENIWPEANLWLVPCINPTGFRLNTRENEEGIDLNRDYRRLRSAEVAAHVRWLQRQPNVDLTLILHEDWEANGFYVYELNPEKRSSLAELMIEAAREVCPIESAELVDLWDCRGGIIRPQVQPKDRPDWAEAIYMIANNSLQNYTLETPSDFPLPLRVKAHVHVTRRALRAFGS